MATLNAITKPYPLITNKIRASLFKQSSPQAVYYALIDDIAGHPARIFTFENIPVELYNFSLDEISNIGEVINNLAFFSVAPSKSSGLLSRNDEQIKSDFTPGFNHGLNEYYFDGRDLGGGLKAPDYIGWSIVPSELTGRGILAKALDYTWDSVFGKFNLIQENDVIQPNQYYNIHFDPVNTISATLPSAGSDFDILYITDDTLLDSTCGGKRIICQPASDFIVITLPDLISMPANRPIDFEISTVGVKCVQIKGLGGQSLRFGDGTIYCHDGESLKIYKFVRNASSQDFEWRVCETNGNFKSVGNIVSSDIVYGGQSNFLLANGQAVSARAYARLYNEFVMQLPIGQVVAFSDWSAIDKKTFYSFVDSTTGNFHVPDRQGLYERMTGAGIPAGTYLQDEVGKHQHVIPYDMIAGGTGQSANLRQDSNGSQYIKLGKVQENDGDETRPKTYFTNKYITI